MTSTTAPTEPSPEEGPATDNQPGEDRSSDHEMADHETASRETASHELAGADGEAPAVNEAAPAVNQAAPAVNEAAPDVEPATGDEPISEREPAADAPEAAEQVRDDEQPSAEPANEVAHPGDEPSDTPAADEGAPADERASDIEPDPVDEPAAEDEPAPAEEPTSEEAPTELAAEPANEVAHPAEPVVDDALAADRPATPAAPAATAERASTAAPAASTTSRPRRTWPFWVAGAATAVVGLATATVVALQPAAPTGPSKSELALTAAQDDAVRLAALARNASQHAAPGAQSALTATAAMLDRQAAVLATRHGTPPASASGTANPPSITSLPSATTAASSPGVASPADVISGIKTSVEVRLSALPDVDGPTASVLASLAAGQSLQVSSLSNVAGSTPPPRSQGSPSPSLIASPSAGSPDATTCPGTPPSPGSAAPSPGSTPVFGAALATVERAETAAVYVLEAALAHTPASSTDANARESALEAHRRQLDTVDALATSACIALPPRDAGFAVPSDFETDPSRSLAAVARSAEESWTQLVAAAPAQRRKAAADGLLSASRLGSGPGTAFPGLPGAGE